MPAAARGRTSAPTGASRWLPDRSARPAAGQLAALILDSARQGRPRKIDRVPTARAWPSQSQETTGLRAIRLRGTLASWTRHDHGGTTPRGGGGRPARGRDHRQHPRRGDLARPSLHGAWRESVNGRQVPGRDRPGSRATARRAGVPNLILAPAPPRRNTMTHRETTATKHRTVQVDGLDIFYREAGDPADPTLLLLHGFPHQLADVPQPHPQAVGRLPPGGPRLPGLRSELLPGPRRLRVHLRADLPSHRELRRHHRPGQVLDLHPGLRRPDRATARAAQP